MTSWIQQSLFYSLISNQIYFSISYLVNLILFSHIRSILFYCIFSSPVNPIVIPCIQYLFFLSYPFNLFGFSHNHLILLYYLTPYSVNLILLSYTISIQSNFIISLLVNLILFLSFPTNLILVAHIQSIVFYSLISSQFCPEFSFRSRILSSCRAPGTGPGRRYGPGMWFSSLCVLKRKNVTKMSEFKLITTLPNWDRFS